MNAFAHLQVLYRKNSYLSSELQKFVKICKILHDDIQIFVGYVLDKLGKRVYNTKHRGKDVLKRYIIR